MSKPDLVKDATRAVKLLGRVARGEMTFLDLLGGLGKGAEAEVIATAEDEKCTKTVGCTAVLGHEGGCVLDCPSESETSPPTESA